MITTFQNDNGLWGYCDGEAVIISPVYSYVKPFQDGIGCVKRLFWGAIDGSGKAVIPFRYKRLERIFECRYLALTLEGNFGVMDNKGEWVITPYFDGIYKLSSSLLKVRKNNDIFLYTKNGHALFENIPVDSISDKIGHYEVKVNSRRYMISEGGSIFEVSEQDDVVLVNDSLLVIFNDNLDFVVKSQIEGDSILIDYLSQILEETIILEDICDGEKNYRLLDKQGALKASYNKMLDFFKLDEHYGLIINMDRQWSIIRNDGVTIIPFSFLGLGIFYNDNVLSDYYDGKYLAATKDGEKVGIIDLEGNELVPFIYDSIIKITDGIVKAHRGKKKEIIDIINNRNFEHEYDAIGEYYDGAILVCKKDCLGDPLWGVIDINGNIVCPCKLKTDGHIYNGKLIVNNAHPSYWGRYVFKDMYGETLSPYEFFSLDDFKDGKSSIETEMYIDDCRIDCTLYDDGKIEISSIALDYTLFVSDILNNYKRLYLNRFDAERYDGFCGVIDGQNVLVLPFDEYGYQDFWHAANKNFSLQIKEKNNCNISIVSNGILYGLVDSEGKSVLPIEYERVYFCGDFIIAHKQTSILLDSYGNFIYEGQSGEFNTVRIINHKYLLLGIDHQNIVAGRVVIDFSGNVIKRHGLILEYEYLIQIGKSALYTKDFERISPPEIFFIKHHQTGYFVGDASDFFEQKYYLYDKYGNLVLETDNDEEIDSIIKKEE